MKKKDFLPFLEHFEHSLYYFTEGTLHPLCLLANNPTEKVLLPYILLSKIVTPLCDGKEYIYVYKGCKDLSSEKILCACRN